MAKVTNDKTDDLIMKINDRLLRWEEVTRKAAEETEEAKLRSIEATKSNQELLERLIQIVTLNEEQSPHEVSEEPADDDHTSETKANINSTLQAIQRELTHIKEENHVLKEEVKDLTSKLKTNTINIGALRAGHATTSIQL